MEIIAVDEEALSLYRGIECSECVYWIEDTDGASNRQDWERWFFAMLERFGPPIMAAVEGNEIVGMIMFSPLDIAPRARGIEPFDIWNRIPQKEHSTSLILYCIYVPREEHRGIGQALMESMINKASQPHQYLSGNRFRSVYAVGAENRPGPSAPKSFLRRFGFNEVEALGSRSVLMKLDLC